MKTEILKIKGSWEEVVDDCRATVSKPPLGHDPRASFNQRSDRTGTPRDKLPQDAPVNFTGEMNAQAAIDTMRKRLCHQASAETRAYAEDFKEALRETEPELSDVLVPNCVYRCGCPEMQTCGLWERMGRETGGCIASQHIDERYDVYNRYFYAHRKETERAAE